MNPTRLFSTFLIAVALVVGIVACGGSDEDEQDTASTPAVQSDGNREDDGARSGDRAAGAKEGAEDGEDGSAPPSAGEGGDGGAGGASDDGGAVDLSVDPSRIDGAVVTRSGAVQTVEPDPEAQETAQENTYPSIGSFGSEAEGQEATNITFALVQYLDAKASGDWATACARLYSVLRERLEGQAKEGDCPQIFGALMSRTSQSGRAEQATIDVSSVRRGEGNRAFVIYKTPQTLSADMPMYVEDGVWKVGAIEAYVLRPEQVG
jgi:hypothetical protein